MNPFSKFLSQWSNNEGLEAFVAYWDRLELLTIAVYKENVTLDEATAEFDEVWPWLRRHYGRWQPQLRPLWQKTKAAGKSTQTDPFQLLLQLTKPGDIQDNWTVMQHLPAAREALNQLLIQRSI